MSAGRESGVSGPVFAGAVVASIGGPLALLALYVPAAAGDGLSAAGLTVALALLVFVAPLAIWLGFSEQVASAGGLAAFVEAAAGRKLAIVQALVWTASYFLYLPYTITYIVYDLLPPVFPGIVPYRSTLEVLLPVAIAVFALAPLSASLGVLGLFAAGQLAIVGALGGLVYSHAGASGSAFTSDVGAAPLGRGVGAVALLFVCASLPLFFAAEVRGGRRTVRRGLASGYAVVGVFLLSSVIPLASIADNVAAADFPGVTVAQAYSGRGFAVAVGLMSAVSVAGLVVLEMLALGRLLHWLAGTAIRPALLAVAVPFVAADALSLIDPDAFYDDLVKPSLVALFVSQLVVFLVYPLLRRRGRRLRPVPIAVSAVASALAGYGLYTALGGSVGT